MKKITTEELYNSFLNDDYKHSYAYGGAGYEFIDLYFSNNEKKYKIFYVDIENYVKTFAFNTIDEMHSCLKEYFGKNIWEIA